MEADDGISLPEADSPSSVAYLRQAWIDAAMEARLDSFALTHDIRVVCGTWNANGKDIPKLELDLAPWLAGAGGPPADLYAVGAQEMVDLTAGNVVLSDAKAAKRADAWCAMVEAALARIGAPAGLRYVRLEARHLVGCFLAVYARAAPTHGARPAFLRGEERVERPDDARQASTAGSARRGARASPARRRASASAASWATRARAA